MPGQVPTLPGHRGVRRDAEDKLRGRFVYATDLVDHPAGTLVARTVRSPVAAGALDAVDVASALRVPGAVTVLTGEELPGRRLGSKVQDQPVLAHREVRHHGEPVVVVVAEDEAAARLMAAAVRLEIRPRTALLDPARALEPDAPRVGPAGNRVAHHAARRGAGHGPVVVRRRWRTGRQDAAFLAPEAALAVPGREGAVDLWVATQDIHADHLQVVRALGMDPRLLRVHHAGIGGAFGGREDITLQAHVVLAALRTGRPVRMLYDRGESLRSHPSRHPMTSEVEITADRAGRFVSLRTRTVLDGGAYAHTSAPVSAVVHDFSAGAYRFDHVDVETSAVYTNNPPAGAMRGFGATQACFLLESSIDELARELRTDPVELRRRNLLRVGEPLAITGQPLTGCVEPADLLGALDEVPLPGAPPPPEHRRGTGVAVGIKSAGLGHGKADPATVELRLDHTGVVVVSAAAEVGQGVSEVLLRMVAAHLPGVPARLQVADTDFPTAGGSKASRQTMASGGAAAEAARRLALRLAERRAADGVPRLAEPACPPGGLAELLGGETWVERVENDGPATGPSRPHKAFQLVAHRATVDVDEITGAVTVPQVVCVQDCGRAIDPVAVEGQLVGGTVQGVGFALWEERAVDAEGRDTTKGFSDYLLPSAADVPDVVPVVLAVPHPDLALGAKGVGEGPLVSSPAAVAAALRDATGLLVDSVPAGRVVPT